MSRSRHVVFVGLMGSGKSTAGIALAEMLGWPFSDSDTWIEATCGITGRQTARRDGVEVLHRLEAEHLLQALAAEEPLVVAAAASVVDDPVCREALGGAFVVWLDPPVETLAERATEGDHRRDLADVGETFTGLHLRRAAAYREVASLHVEGSPEPDAVAAMVAAALLHNT